MLVLEYFWSKLQGGTGQGAFFSLLMLQQRSSWNLINPLFFLSFNMEKILYPKFCAMLFFIAHIESMPFLDIVFRSKNRSLKVCSIRY